MFRNFLDNRHIGGRRQFGAAQRARQQQAEQSAPGQGVNHRLGQFAAALDRRAGPCELRAKLARALQIRDARRCGAFGVRWL